MRKHKTVEDDGVRMILVRLKREQREKLKTYSAKQETSMADIIRERIKDITG